MIDADDFYALAAEHGTWVEALAANPTVTESLLPLLDDHEIPEGHRRAIFEIWLAQALGYTVTITLDDRVPGTHTPPGPPETLRQQRRGL